MHLSGVCVACAKRLECWRVRQAQRGAVIDYAVIDSRGSLLDEMENWAEWREVVRETAEFYESHPDHRDPDGDCAIVNFGATAGGGPEHSHTLVMGR